MSDLEPSVERIEVANKNTTIEGDGLQRFETADAIAARKPTADPLSWSFIIKCITTINICGNVLACNFYGGGLVPTLVPVATEFGVPVTQGATLFSYNVLAQGLGNLVWVPLMINLGKRWTMLLTMVLFLPCIAWGASAQSFNSLFASRIVGGFAAGASESFGPAIIGDLWYEHQLTTAIGLFTACLLAGTGLGQVVLGYVATGAGWRWSYWVTFILAAVNTICILFFMPETTYKRGLEVGITAGDVERAKSGKEAQIEDARVQAGLPRDKSNIESFSLRKNLWYTKHNHIDYHNNFLISFIRPMAFTFSPTILWASLAYSVTVGGFTAIGVIVPQIFSAPPYNFSSSQQGLFGLSGLIGILIGGSLGSKIVDMFNMRQERNNLRRGLAHKPEERLLILVIPFALAPTGLVMYDAFLDKKLSWVGPAFGYGIHSVGLSVLASICFSYAVDSYLVRSGEVMVFMNVCRCLLSFAFADVSPDWLVETNGLVVYGTLGGIGWLFILLGVPVYFFGPWLRSKTDRFL